MSELMTAGVAAVQKVQLSNWINVHQSQPKYRIQPNFLGSQQC